MYMDGPRKKVWAWIGFFIVLVALAAVAIGAAWHPSSTAPEEPVNYPNPAPSAPIYAPAGALVSGFAQGLVLDNAPSFTQSYAVRYSATSTQYTATWNSSSSMNTLFAAYQKYFSANGWSVAGESASASNLRNIDAANGTEYANVTISAQGKGSQVTVSYLQK